MDASRPPASRRPPPAGVPRWLWPPPGASVSRHVLREARPADAPPRYEAGAGGAPAPRHLRALLWLLDEHPAAAAPPPGRPFEGEIVLEVARTELAAGRVGHAYALDGGPLGDPGADEARGILGRWIEHALAAMR